MDNDSTNNEPKKMEEIFPTLGHNKYSRELWKAIKEAGTFPLVTHYPTGFQEILRRQIFPLLKMNGYKYHNSPTSNRLEINIDWNHKKWEEEIKHVQTSGRLKRKAIPVLTDTRFFGIDLSQDMTLEIKENFLTDLFHRGFIDRENYQKALKEYFGNKLKGNHRG